MRSRSFSPLPPLSFDMTWGEQEDMPRHGQVEVVGECG
jgi:hypothetical protein